jgi:NAD(P)-dependent dehydrogenase (short-subunit alcohol dehydrogenase family)
VTRAALSSIRASVTWLTGAAARTAIAGLGNYAAANGALNALIGPLAMEFAPIRINCVASGLARTDFWNKLGMAATAQEAMFADAARALPVQRVAEASDIAEALFFAATNRSTTGTILDTSGGLQLGRLDTQAAGASFGGVDYAVRGLRGAM